MQRNIWIVSTGRVDQWLKIKNPAEPAVKREAEEDWRTLGKRLR